MLVTVKSVGIKTYKYEVKPEDKLSEIVTRLYNDNNIDSNKNTIKIIYRGRFQNLDKLFSEFEEENLTLVYVIGKNDSVPNPVNTYVETSNTQPSLTSNESSSNPPVSNNRNNETSESERLRAGIGGLLIYIRSNPALTELFNNNIGLLLNVLMSPEFKTVFDKIIEGLTNNNEDLSEETESLPILLPMPLSLGMNNAQPVNTFRPIPVNDALSEQDQDNINTLMNLGFTREQSLEAYLMCRKNLELAASMLMDSSFN